MTNEELKARIAAATTPLVLLDFHADWCGACQVMMPALDKFVAEHPEKVELIKINVDGDGNRELARVFGISSIPALFLYKDGHVVERNTIVGSNLVATVMRHF